MRTAATVDEIQRRLGAELAKRDGNMRRLARDINPDELETVRRMLYRILRDGAAPTEETSRTLERGLGKPAGYFSVARDSGRRSDRQAELEGRVAELEDALNHLGPAVEKLARRVSVLERRAPPRKRSA